MLSTGHGLSHSCSFINWFQKNVQNNKYKNVEDFREKKSRPLTFKEYMQVVCNKTLFLQSEDIAVAPSDSLESVSSVTSQVLTFVDSSEGDIQDEGFSQNAIAKADGSANTNLGQFLSRPTLIDSRVWTTASLNGVLGAVVLPWSAYLSNAIIKNKLNNYAFLRAKLCIKILINSTPFHFGLMRAAYEPSVGFRTSKIRTNTVSPNPLIVPYSQLPGVWIHPADNSGGTLKVPFFLHTSWLNLKNLVDCNNMGTLTYYIAAPLQVATTTGSTSITIDTFAWLEDVELNGSTNELTLQSKDEYDGPISKVASTVATVMGMLERVPVIGPYAKASAIGAGAMAEVAGHFGYTNIPNISDISGIVPMVGPHLATSEISVPYQKLTLDPKQELSLDPSLHGVGNTDELAIKSIVQRESALTMLGWATTDTVGTVIFNARVNPAALFSSVQILDAGLVNRADRVYHTPLSYVGQLFQHWRGDIIFDFEVVCTKFHKGRLKISWDPLSGQGIAALPENTVYTTILDIGETNVASICVPYHSEYAWLRTRGTGAAGWTPGTNLVYTNRFDNGMLLLSVLTPLMSPDAPENISVKVTVRAANNFEYANPRSFLGDSITSQPPSTFTVQAKDEVDISPQITTFGDYNTPHIQRYALNHGERIVSLRPLMHRMSLYDVSTPFTNAATRFVNFEKSYARLPPMYGYDSTGKSTANKILAGAGTAPFNYVPTHPLTYISIMFGAYRGSVNYVANVSTDLTPAVSQILVQRLSSTTDGAFKGGLVSSSQNTGANASNTTRFLNFVSPPSLGGAVLANTMTNGSIMWNNPNYSACNFAYADATYSIDGNTFDQTDRAGCRLDILLKQSTANSVTDYATISTYAGSGPDFTCLWWLCCPTIDYYVSLPTAP